MILIIYTLFLYGLLFSSKSEGMIIYDGLDCRGKIFRNVTLSAYYPDNDDESTINNLDIKGKKLKTLQDFIDDRADYITLSIDSKLQLPYGTHVCIPELNKHFGKRLEIQVRDNGSNLINKNFTRADICVRTEADSYDNAVNRLVTLVF